MGKRKYSDQINHLSLRYWKNFIFQAGLITAILCICYPVNEITKWDYSTHCREWELWYTAFTGPWFHANFEHISGNLISLVSLMALFYSWFPQRSCTFFLLQYVLSAVILFFLGAENSRHIGASVWVFSYLGFLLTIFLTDKNRRTRAFGAGLILFFGGNILWGLLPTIPNISYVGHASGLIAGVLLALIDHKGWQTFLPQENTPEWMSEEDTESNPYDV